MPPLSIAATSDSAPRDRTDRLTRRTTWLLLIVLAIPFLGVGLLQAWRDAPTIDEGAYIASGVSLLTRHQFRINVEHPPLAKVAAALPVLVAHPIVPRGQSWRDGAEYTYTAEFLQAASRTGRLHRIVFLARLVPLAEGVGVAVALYALAAGLFGREAGVAAAGLWLTMPLAVAFAHVDGIDVPFTLVTLLALLALHRYLRSPTIGRAALLGLAGGVCLLTRSSGLVVVPVLAVSAAVMAAHRRAAHRAGHAAVTGLIVLVLAWLTVWAGMLAIAPSTPHLPSAARLQAASPEATHEPGFDRIVLAVPWPHEYATGIRYLGRVSLVRAPVYLVGQAWRGARWWYWLVVLAVKVPIGALVFIVAGTVAHAVADRKGGARATSVLLPSGLALAVFTMLSPRPIGIRLLLPVIALLIVSGSALATTVLNTSNAARRRLGVSALVVIALGQGVALAGAREHALAWTAPPFHPGYRVTTDSNLDWGQDYSRLAAWARGRDAWVAYFGPPGMADTLTGVRPLLGADPVRIRGWVAASATYLTANRRDDLAWLRAYCPTGDLGGSILLYRFDTAPDPAPGSAVPAAPCPGQPSHRR